MPTRPKASLLEESQDWIAEMLSEDGIMVTGAFVELVQNFEWDALEADQIGPDDRAGMVQHIIDRCGDENIQVGPMPSTLSTNGGPEVWEGEDGVGWSIMGGRKNLSTANITLMLRLSKIVGTIRSKLFLYIFGGYSKVFEPIVFDTDRRISDLVQR